MWLYNHIGIIFVSLGVVIVGLLTVFYMRVILSENATSQHVHVNAKSGMAMRKHRN